MLDLGPRAVDVLTEVFEDSRYRSDDSLVFCHPALGTPLDPPSSHASTCAPPSSGRR